MSSLDRMAGLLEAFLFAKGDPVSLKEMAEALEEDSLKIEEALHVLQEKYDKPDSGITLHHTGAGWSLTTKKMYDEWLSSLLGKQSPLSSSALETLAVVAFKEPVTRTEIEKIRGVSAGRVLAGLLEKGLIEERGRLDVPGRPILYGTTKRFLQCTGLSDISELRTRWSGKLMKENYFERTLTENFSTRRYLLPPQGRRADRFRQGARQRQSCQRTRVGSRSVL